MLTSYIYFCKMTSTETQVISAYTKYSNDIPLGDYYCCCRWVKLTIIYTNMDISQSWWRQRFATSRTCWVFWGIQILPTVIADLKVYTSLGFRKINIKFMAFCCSFNRVDYIIAPLKVLQSLKESVTTPDEKYSFVRRLSPQSAASHSFSDEEVWF